MKIWHGAAHELGMLGGSVRQKLWTPCEAVEVAYIGGVFGSELLRERFRMLVELTEGVRCGPPKHGPAVGALVEAYPSAGLLLLITNNLRGLGLIGEFLPAPGRAVCRSS